MVQEHVVVAAVLVVAKLTAVGMQMLLILLWAVEILQGLHAQRVPLGEIKSMVTWTRTRAIKRMTDNFLTKSACKKDVHHAH